ncbi:MAG: hypothetical protein WCW34_04450 [Patescibacteria group bacterium]|jgi:hypothetical protein
MAEENKYPRAVGSDTIVTEKQWNQSAPFGYCPACGRIGIEELNIPGDPDICFYCPDEGCKTIQNGRSQPARTKWNSEKTEELLEREAQGETWNVMHFPCQSIPDICPD